jgi:hypothetical protein
MLALLITFLCAVLITVISWLVMKRLGSGSDQYYHLYLVDLIIKNKMRFVREHTNVLNTNMTSYPQLIHWVIAVFKRRNEKIAEYLKWLQLPIAFIQVVLLAGVIYLLLPEEQVVKNFEITLLIALLIFSTTPFNFLPWNAKNHGFSIRGIGIVLGQILLYSICIVTLGHSYVIISIAAGVLLLCILSSQFATQYGVGLLVVGSLVLMDPYLLIILGFGILLFYALFPNFSIAFFKGQKNHKTLYSKYLAKVFIFKQRESIWGDFITSFPGALKHEVLVNKRLKFFSLPYVKTNPVVSVLLDIPLFIPLLIEGGVSWDNLGTLEVVIWKLLFVHIVIFILTSFRTTRFLGEPQRYIEFAFGLLAFYFVLRFNDNPILFSSLVAAHGLFFAISFLKLLKGAEKSLRVVEDSKIKTKLDDYFAKENLGKVRFFTNNHDLSKKTLNVEMRQFYFWPAIITFDGFHFTELFKTSYAYIEEDMIVKIINKYKVSHFLLDSNYCSEGFNLLEDSNFKCQIIFQENGYYFLQIDNYFQSN